MLPKWDLRTVPLRSFDRPNIATQSLQIRHVPLQHTTDVFLETPKHESSLFSLGSTLPTYLCKGPLLDDDITAGAHIFVKISKEMIKIHFRLQH